MNYAAAVVTYPVECIACGRELGEDALDPAAVACDGCYQESEAKAAIAREDERRACFQFLAHEWFRLGEVEERPKPYVHGTWKPGVY